MWFSPASSEESWQHITHIAGENIGIIWGIVPGPDGSVCFLGFNGAYRYSDSRWEKIYSCNQSNAYGIAIDSEENVWKVEYGKISKYFDNEWLQVGPGISKDFILTRRLSIGLDGTVWVASGNGIYRYDGISWKCFTVTDGLYANYIEHIATDSGGNIWCTHGDYSSTFCDPGPCPPGGISRFHNGEWGGYDDTDGLTSGHVYSIIPGKDSRLYAISHNGISRFTGGTWKKVLTTNREYRMTVGPDDVIWKTDGNTLYHHNGSTWSAHEGMPGQLTAFNLRIGVDGTVWLGTTNGIVRYNSDAVVSVSDRYPLEWKLLFNHPNPFNPSTTIAFTLPLSGQAYLSVYSITGQKVRELVFGYVPAGVHSVVWDGRDDRGNVASSGVYLTLLNSGGKVCSARMLLMK
jgi:hypothetical protein